MTQTRFPMRFCIQLVTNWNENYVVLLVSKQFASFTVPTHATISEKIVTAFITFLFKPVSNFKSNPTFCSALDGHRPASAAVLLPGRIARADQRWFHIRPFAGGREEVPQGVQQKRFPATGAGEIPSLAKKKISPLRTTLFVVVLLPIPFLLPPPAVSCGAGALSTVIAVLSLEEKTRN